MGNRFFFDNCVPPCIVDVLKAMGVDGVHLRDEFHQGIKDVEWMPTVATSGYLSTVTADERILKRPAERELRKSVKLTTVFLHGFSELGRWQQLLYVAKAWPDIEKWSCRAAPGDCARVSANRKLEQLKNP